PDVAAGPVPTTWLERTLPALSAAPAGLTDALALAAWSTLRPSAGDGDPWTRRDGWRQSDQGTAHLDWACAGARQTIAVAYVEGGLACAFGGDSVLLTGGSVDGTHVRVQLDNRVVEGHVVPDGDALVVLHAAGRTVLRRPVGGPGGPDGAAGDGRIVAPLPGRVVEVMVASGQTVAVGEPLLALEAMKMQHMLNADRAGVVEAVNCSAGDQVARGDLLVAIAAESG
ncbi:MAG: acetyl-CoA carboxylase biotin carboxyl carrier protein subunit, partial [Alphaproteobacteria bacterium]